MELEGIHIFSQKEMDDLVRALNMPPSSLYRTFSEEEMNRLSAYCRAFDEYEGEILIRTEVSLDEVLLSKYYWRARMEALDAQFHGHHGDFGQYTYQAIEELDQRLEDVDWQLVERLNQEIESQYGREN